MHYFTHGITYYESQRKISDIFDRKYRRQKINPYQCVCWFKIKVKSMEFLKQFVTIRMPKQEQRICLKHFCLVFTKETISQLWVTVQEPKIIDILFLDWQILQIYIRDLLKIFEAVQSVSVLIVISVSNIQANKGGNLADLQKIVSGFVGGGIQELQQQNAIKVNITKWQPTRMLPNFNIVLNKFVHEEEDSFRKRMVRNGNVLCCGVLSERDLLKGSASVEKFNQVLSQMGKKRRNQINKHIKSPWTKKTLYFSVSQNNIL